ncbi:hypothetical protein [Ekhidna sp.]
MTRLLQLATLALIAIACSGPQKNKEEDKAKETSESNEASQPSEESSEKIEGDQYKLVLRHVDNRVIVYVNDSTIFDTGTVYGEYVRNIDLTKYVNAGQTDLKVELYNGKPPYDTMSPGWMIVYDIFINDELVEFVREEKQDGKVGLVYTESHDLSDIW